MSPTLAVRVAHRALGSSWATLPPPVEAPVPSSISRTRTTSRDARRLTPAALLALLLALVLTLAGCGGGSGSDDSGSAAETSAGGDFPVTLTGADGELTLEEQPDTIVSMSAST